MKINIEIKKKKNVTARWKTEFKVKNSFLLINDDKNTRKELSKICKIEKYCEEC